MQPNDVLSDKQSFINLQTHCVKYFVLCESQVYPDLLLRTSEILGHKVIEEECTALISWFKLLSKQCAYQSFQTGTTDSTFKMVLKEMVVILGAMHIWERKFTGLQYLYPKVSFYNFNRSWIISSWEKCLLLSQEPFWAFQEESLQGPTAILRSLELTLTPRALVALLHYMLFAYFFFH